MFVMPKVLTGKRVLIVEDEFLVAMVIEEFLLEFGCIAVGPFGTLETALEAAQTEAFDVAVLDAYLNGERVYPVVEVLAERQIPFVFASGYGDDLVPAHSDWTVCAKPFSSEDIAIKLSVALGKAGVTPPRDPLRPGQGPS